MVGLRPTGITSAPPLHDLDGVVVRVWSQCSPPLSRLWTDGACLRRWPLCSKVLFGAARFIPGAGSDLSNPEEAMKTKNRAYRSAVAVALAAALILVWLSLGVGVIGADGDPANLMYAGVLAVAIAGGIIVRFRPHGMARTLFATAFAQALVAVIALIAGLGYPASPPLEILALNGFFVALFAGSALLFRHAAREQLATGL
jgi:peptidoglycan/LPS O-acetylase OafA/YrhL